MAIALATKLAPARKIAFSQDDFSTLVLHKFTVDQYHRLIQAGVFGKYDRVQLLEGRIVKKMTHNPPHDTAIALTQAVVVPLLPADWHTRIQSAITTPDSEPEPDIAIVRGKPRQYSVHHPRAKDIGMIVEVADTTLRDDRTIQYRIYARCRIPIYWIINLVDEKVEVYTKPKGGKNAHYDQHQEYSKDQSIPLVFASIQLGTIPVKDLLP